jgi:hypothetical protein
MRWFVGGEEVVVGYGDGDMVWEWMAWFGIRRDSIVRER